jgi:hypothetical protein
MPHESDAIDPQDVLTDAGETAAEEDPPETRQAPTVKTYNGMLDDFCR